MAHTMLNFYFNVVKKMNEKNLFFTKRMATTGKIQYSRSKRHLKTSYGIKTMFKAS